MNPIQLKEKKNDNILDNRRTKKTIPKDSNRNTDRTNHIPSKSEIEYQKYLNDVIDPRD